MIIGLGSDIIDNRRIKKILDRFGMKFKNRCFSNNEILNSKNIFHQENYFAKRFAAKEACAKALGTGFSKGVFMKDIEVTNNEFGKPSILLHNKALSKLNKLTKLRNKIEVSLSDEDHYSIANVIIFNDEH